MRVLIIIGIWEIIRRRAFSGREPSRRTAESQTSGSVWESCVLPDEVPHKAHILFSFWKAGLKVDEESYSQEVQSDLYALIGDWMSRLSEEGYISD